MGKLQTGDRAPVFALEDADGKTWRLTELQGHKVILFFYPADDTPGCTIEACDFRDSLDVWEKSGYVILGVSPQGAESKRAFRDKYGLNFPLLIDEDLTAHDAYGVLRERPSERSDISTKRSTFVIDESGMLIEALYEVDPRDHVDDLRERLAI